MKRVSYLLLVVFCSTCIVSAGRAAATAGEFSAGIIAMYGWWEPFAANYLQQLDRKKVIKTTFSMKDSSALYGPFLSWQATESWNLSFTLLMAVHDQFSASSNNLTLGMEGLHLARTTLSHMERYDADLRATKKLNKYAGVFVAANLDVSKYFGGYNIIITAQPLLPLELPAKGSLRSYEYDCGPGVGAALGFELAKNLTLNMRLSLYVMGGTLTRKVQHEQKKVNTHLAFKTIEDVTLSYRIDPAGIILSIGGRYQAMTFAAMTMSPREFFHNYTTLFDQLGGVTMSAAVVF